MNEERERELRLIIHSLLETLRTARAELERANMAIREHLPEISISIAKIEAWVSKAHQ